MTSTTLFEYCDKLSRLTPLQMVKVVEALVKIEDTSLDRREGDGPSLDTLGSWTERERRLYRLLFDIEQSCDEVFDALNEEKPAC
jgi:hypothetical protein